MIAFINRSNANQIGSETSAIFTLYEGNYHLGVAALINSAVAVGFKGNVFVGYRDLPPPWLGSLIRDDDKYFAADVPITFFKTTPKRHLGYQKPFTAVELFERYLGIETLFYADPDITFVAPWSFFDQWVDCGVTLVLDCNFPELALNHPWRSEWRALGASCGLKMSPSQFDYYANSGFFGIKRQDAELLATWVKLTEQFEADGGDTGRFLMTQRHRAVVGDQDLLAAAMMHTAIPYSPLGGHAMGFHNYFYILSHAIESPKPWSKCFIADAIRGKPPSQAAKRFLEHSQGVIRTKSHFGELKMKIDFRCAQLLSRFYKRAN